MKTLQNYFGLFAIILFFMLPIALFAQCPLMPGSTLIDANDEAQMSQWFGSNSYRGTLIYKMSKDGMSASAFHSRCDNQGATLVLIKNLSTGQVFGGYNPQSWTSITGYVAGTGAFLFNLTYNYKLNQVNANYQTYNNLANGPTFGGGYDIFTPLNGTSGYTNVNSYESPVSKGYPNLSGGSTFKVAEVEVYKLAGGNIVASGPTVLCAGSSVTLTAPLGIAYQWSNGANTASISVGQSGDYSVLVSSQNANCPALYAHQNVIVGTPLSLGVSQINAQTGTCTGSIILLPSGGIPPYNSSSVIDFSGTEINSRLLSYGGPGAKFIQNGDLKMNGNSNQWNNYLFAQQTTPRTVGKVFQGKVFAEPNTYAMIGWHNTSTNADWSNMVHAFYFYNGGGLDIYENGISKGSVGNYPNNIWYDFKIELLSAGAKYYIKPSSSSTWNLVYTSNTFTNTDLRMGLSLYGYGSAYNNYFHTDDWSDGLGGTPLKNLCPGTYQYSITDSIGCTATAQVSIIEGSDPVEFTAAGTNASCFGSSNGSITISAKGGEGAFMYSINDGQTYYSDNVFSGLPAGIYVLRVKDAVGKLALQITNIQIFEPSVLSASSSAGTISCNGGSTMVSVSANGGATPYTGTGDFNVTAGTFSYIVTDANGCLSNTTIIVSEPSPLSASSSAGTISCNGGSTMVSVSANGGTAPYTGTGDFNVIAGTYSYAVTDANGCSSNTNITISEPSPLSASSSAGTISCNGGSTMVSVSANGGTLPYTGTGDFNVIAGTYSYAVTDANGCTSGTTFTVIQPTALISSIAPLPTSSISTCSFGTSANIVVGYGGGSKSITMSGSASGGTMGYTYSWSPSEGLNNANIANPVFTSSLQSGFANYSFTLTVKDAVGCISSASTIVKVVNVLATIEHNNPDVNCNNCLNDKKVKICHNNKVIEVSVNAVQAHLGHGDCIGDCNKGRAMETLEVITVVEEQMAIYPNPTKGKIIITLNNVDNTNKVQVEIHDINSKSVYSGDLDNSFDSVSQEFDLQDVLGKYGSGLYYVNVINGESLYSKKIIFIK